MKRLLIILSFPAFLLAARFIPFSQLPSVCYFYNVTHYPCPTCGMTRSVEAIAHIQLARAVHFNPFGFLFVIFLAAAWVDGIRRSFTGEPSRMSLWLERHLPVLTVLFFGILTLFGAIRIWLCIHHIFAW